MSFGFEEVYEDSVHDLFILRECSTDCLYLQSAAYNGSGGLTVMVNPKTGRPLTYSDWKNNFENSENTSDY